MSKAASPDHAFVGPWRRSREKVAADVPRRAFAAAEREFASAQIEAAKRVVDFWAGKASQASIAKPK